MPHSIHRRVSGFTLTEMAIVLAVVGVLAAGLWNLLAGANTQVRDQAAASQQEQLVNAVKTFLVSADGQNFMKTNGTCGGNCAPGANFPLSLPAACPSGAFGNMTLAEAGTWCNDLPPGFNSNTTNSYGQKYLIQILRDGTAAGQPPNSYSFMIMTTGGNVITDTSGSRISSLIGGDGGFIYSAAAGVCGAPVANWACGSYGGWAATPAATYGFAASASGTIASRTYYSPAQNTFTNWLARIQLPGDSNFTYNTMTVPEYLGNNALVMGAFNGTAPAVQSINLGTAGTEGSGAASTLNLEGGVINFDGSGGATTPGAINAQGGAINMQAGTIHLQGGTITSDNNQDSSISMLNPPSNNNTSPNALINIQSGCAQNAPGTPAGCFPALQVGGDVNVSNLVNANALYAGTFIYQSSDIRLKKDIHPLENSLSDIMRLKPVSFTFKSNDQKGLGVIAQDIEKVYPQLVSGENMKSVNYEGLIGPLIGAVQELKQENDQLRAQIQEQAGRERKLEQELRARQSAE